MNPGSRSRFGPPQPNLAELKLLTDDQLMVHLQEGVNDALAVLFERYHRLVFSIALKIVRDRGRGRRCDPECLPGNLQLGGTIRPW